MFFSWWTIPAKRNKAKYTVRKVKNSDSRERERKSKKKRPKRNSNTYSWRPMAIELNQYIHSIYTLKSIILRLFVRIFLVGIDIFVQISTKTRKKLRSFPKRFDCFGYFVQIPISPCMYRLISFFAQGWLIIMPICYMTMDGSRCFLNYLNY